MRPIRSARPLRALRASALATVVAMLGVLAGTALPAHALAGSTFESTDGDLVVVAPGNFDWQNAPNLTTGIDTPSGGSDSSFGSGVKEDTVNPPITVGGVPSSKDDLTRFYVAHQHVGSNDFVYLAWERSGTSGSATIDFELNASNALDANGVTPTRTAGDLLITYDFGGNGAPDLNMLRWVTSGATTQCEVSSTLPCWGNKVKLSLSGFADGAVNAIATLDPISGQTLGASSFGEAAVNLTAAGVFNPSTCTAFGHAMAKARSSNSFTAQMKDYIAPIAVDINNCSRSQLAKAVRNVTTGQPSPTGSYATSVAANPGDTLEYQLVYTNVGNDTATSVVVTDPVPAHSTYVTCTGGTSCSQANGTITWNLPNVAINGSQTLTFTVTLASTFDNNVTPITNTAHAATADEPAGVNSNTVTVTVTANPVSSLDKSARNTRTNESGTSITAAPGDVIEYTLTYTNGGTGPATNVAISDPVPDHSTLLSCNPVCDSITTPGTLKWTIPLVAASGTTSVSFQVTLDSTFDQKVTTITNVGTVDTDQEAPSDSNPATVMVTGSSSSALTKSVENITTGDGPDTEVAATPGDTIEYTLTYTNNGSVPATGIVVTDPVPDHSTYVSCDGVTACGESGGTVTWNLPSVAAGNSFSVTFRVVLDATFTQTTTTITNKGHARTDDEPDGVDSNVATVTVTALPVSAITKTVQNITTGEGPSGTSVSGSASDVVEYVLTYTNDGNGPATNVTITDAIPPGTTFLTCSDTCDTLTMPGSVQWTIPLVAAGDSVSVSFRVTLDSHFPSGTTVIPNTASVTTTQEPDDATSKEVTVVVTASPDLSLVKTSDAETSVQNGDTITYTLTYTNNGSGDATGVTIREAVPAGTAFDGCSDSCTTDGPPVTTATWNVGTVDGAGGTGSVTFTVRVLVNVGCQICNQATVSSIDQNQGEPVQSNQLCITATPGPNPALAGATGDAFALHVNEPLLSINETISPVSSSRSGLGPDSTMSDEQGNPKVAGVFDAHLLTASSTSSVTSGPARSSDTSTAEVANVDILGGLVTADVVRAVAGAEATGTASSFSDAGSTITNLVVNGVSVTDITPGLRVDLPVAVFGAGSYVALFERDGGTGGPASGQASGGTYSADLTVNMIRVHITDQLGLLGGGVPLEIVVAHAHAHAAFPQITLCQPATGRSVSGHALIASAATNPSLAPAVEGYADIPATGGHGHQDLLAVAVPDDGSVMSGGAATTDSTGSVAGDPSATSVAEVGSVCLLPDPITHACTIRATTLRSQSSSTATSGGASSSAAGTQLVGLVIGGTPIDATPAPNTPITIPGVGVVILNEQTCDNGGTLAASCGDGTVAGHSGLTVRAVHVILLGGTASAPGADIVIAEAHSDASRS